MENKAVTTVQGPGWYKNTTSKYWLYFNVTNYDEGISCCKAKNPTKCTLAKLYLASFAAVVIFRFIHIESN